MAAACPSDLEPMLETVTRLFQQRLDLLRTQRTAVELELRLGRRDDTGFQSTVDPDFFQDLEASLLAFQGWSSVDTEPVVSTAYIHSDQIRTTTTWVGTQPQITHHRKQRRGECFGVHTCDAGEPRMYDLRVSLNTETPVPSHSVDAVVEPTLVRMRRRRSFVLDGIWRFDLTRSWTGKSRSDVENQMATQPPDHEVEIEYVAGLAHAKHNCARHAHQLLLHMASFYEAYTKAPGGGWGHHRFSPL